jgi:hypothetical protein
MGGKMHSRDIVYEYQKNVTILFGFVTAILFLIMVYHFIGKYL